MPNKHDILKLNVFRSLAVAWYDACLGLIFNSGELRFDTRVVQCLRCLLKTIFGTVCIQIFSCSMIWYRLMSDVLFRGYRLESRLRIGGFHVPHKQIQENAGLLLLLGKTSFLQFTIYPAIRRFGFRNTEIVMKWITKNKADIFPSIFFKISGRALEQTREF
jgi:hypothetical protein